MITHRVLITATALADLQRSFLWLSQRAPQAAERWRDSLLKAVQTLESHPHRCPLAPESDWFDGELRNLLYGKKRSVYRIIFEVRDDIVYVLRIRHSAQDLLDPDEL